MMGVIEFILANYQSIITSAVAILTGIIGICLILPGEQPEKALQGIVDFLSKFSNKSKSSE
jgi:hypothetical protein